MGALYLTDLADLAREAGCTVIEVQGWQTRSRGSGGFDSPRGISIHHTAESPMMDGAASVNYMTFNALNKPITNIYIQRNGTIWICAAGATNTSGKGGPYLDIPIDSANARTIGIEMANNGTGETWTEEQQDAAVKLVSKLFAVYGPRFGWGNEIERVFAHFEWAPTRKIDPWGPARYNDYTRMKWRMDQFRIAVLQGAPTVPPPVTPPTIPPTPPDSEDTLKGLTTPVRVLDTRANGGSVVQAGQIVEVAIMANEVGVNICVVDPPGPGFLTAWGANPRPNTANVNFTTKETQSNYSHVVLDNGTLRLWVSQPCHIVVDMQASG